MANTPASPAPALPLPSGMREGLWVAGRSQEASDRRTFRVEDPATGTEVAQVSDGTAADAERAVDAAAAAARSWASVAPRTRADILHRAFVLMLDNSEALTNLIVAENGKSLTDARNEVVYAAEFFRWFGEECVRTDGNYGEGPLGGTRTIVRDRPVGVAALVTPWNFPAAMVTRKIAPALAAGCTAVLKPAAETPLTALSIARLLQSAGVPDGVVNVVPTLAAGSVVSSWLEDRRVRKLSFTGSTGVGRHLLRQAADRVVNSSMELGGSAPLVVTDDADLDMALAGAAVAKFRNGGQACTAANRFFVHTSIAQEFIERFTSVAHSLTVGPASHGHPVGPMINAQAVTKLRTLVDEAVAVGAKVAFQSEAPRTRGHFFPVTVLTDLPTDAAILEQEIFGPVTTITTWDDEAQLVDDINRSELGLAAYVFSRDLQRALRIAESLEVGMVGINRGVVSDPAAPFGGMKQSGIGREGARHGLREFQEVQTFSIDWPLPEL